MSAGLFNPTPFIEQLLGRTTIEGDKSAAEAFLSKHRILVTGAGGSIGSALVEYLVSLHPIGLILLDHHENSLFQLRQRVIQEHPDGELSMRFVLADVRDRRKMAAVLKEYSPEIIFHLAAYKHVPLAEESPEEFVSINVLGTWRLLQEARSAGVKKVIYPSTDKAVNPPSIYGATKRIVEIMLQAFANEEPGIQLTAVRLVNVLGAHGGVIETFAHQINAGRELTVTDPEMTRYWITMEEALYLLTQAAYAGKTGSILILDLGEPVKVVDIAHKLWNILGSPEKDLPVRYIGARPGERMSEYLFGVREFTAECGIYGILEVKSKESRQHTIAGVTEMVVGLEELVNANAKAELRDRLFSFVKV